MKHLYLYNDNKNTFQKVWVALQKFAKHTPDQAEQCCLIAHQNGRCHIKQGDVIDLISIQANLEKLNIKVELKDEKYVS
jgi:ATP-dependent Clp protease adaptor protein ClpS